MNLNEYQDRAAETAVYPGQNSIGGVIYTTLGLAGEAGETANKVKKVLRDADGHLTDKAVEGIVEELGDCLWYIAMLSLELGFNLDTVAGYNVEKLQTRQYRGTLHGSGDDR